MLTGRKKENEHKRRERRRKMLKDGKRNKGKGNEW